MREIPRFFHKQTVLRNAEKQAKNTSLLTFRWGSVILKSSTEKGEKSIPCRNRGVHGAALRHILWGECC